MWSRLQPGAPSEPKASASAAEMGSDSAPVLAGAHSTLLLALCLIACIPAFAQVTAITVGTLIDPESGTEKTQQIILIEGGRIKEVGSGVRIPEGATRIDLSHESVLPGLFDAHTHLLATVDAKWDL